PIGPEASAPHADAPAVDVVALGEMIDPGGIAALGGRIAVGHGVLARARHVHRQGGVPGPMEEPRGALAILLPAVDPTPMHDHRWPADTCRDLQIADERLALERDLDNRKRRLVMLRRFAEQAQGMLIGLLLARRAGDGITGDMAIFERKRVEFRELLSRCAGFGARVRLPLVGETDLAPRRGPVIAIKAGERIDHLFGIVTANALE